MQRVVGIALGHEDLVNHDQLRHDPVLAIGRLLRFILHRAGHPGEAAMGVRVSNMGCLEVSSRQTTGRSGSCGR